MNVKDAAIIIARILSTAAIATPEPFGALMRIAAAGISAGAEALDSGVTEAQVVAGIHRVRHLTP